MLAVEGWKARHPLPCCSPLCGHKVDNAWTSASMERVCQECGSQPPKGLHSVRWIDYTPDPHLEWQSCERLTSRHVPQRGRKRGKYGTLEDLLSDIAAGDGRTCHLHGSVLKPSRTASRQHTASFMVWRTPAAGGTVLGGGMALPENGILLLHGHGVRFADFQFRGGVIMIAGAVCSALFERCSFVDCALYAVHAASITLANCSFAKGKPAVFASGTGTHVSLHASFFEACATGVIVAAGGTATVHRCNLSNMGSCLVIDAEGSYAELYGVSMDAGALDHPNLYGVAMHEGSLRMRRCSVSGLVWCVRATGHHAHMEIHDSYSEDCHMPLELAGGTSATLREVEVRAKQNHTPQGRAMNSVVLGAGSGGYPGAWAGSRASVQAERCMFRHPSGRAVLMHAGCRVSLHCCNLHSLETAVDIDAADAVLSTCHAASVDRACNVGRGSMRAYSCQLEGGQVAVGGRGASRVVCVDTHCHCSVPGANLCVVGITGDSRLWLLRCHVFSGVTGVHVWAGVCVAVATRVTGISEVLHPEYGDRYLKTAMAAYACWGGKVVVRGGTVQACGTGVSAEADTEGEPGVVQVSNVVFEQFSYSAVAACKGCWAHIADCTIRGKFCNADADLDRLAVEISYVQRCAKHNDAGLERSRFSAVQFKDARGGIIRGCRFEGNAQDLFAHVRERLEVTDSEFVKNPCGETLMDLGDRVHVQGCTTKAIGDSDSRPLYGFGETYTR
eukprot:jgi/Ulvmu1/6299/UM029_0006.1